MTDDEFLVKTDAGDMTWKVPDKYRTFLVERLVPMIDDDENGVPRRVIKRSRVRTVTRFEMPEKRTVYVKHYRTVRPLDRLLFSFLPGLSRSRREWNVIRALQRKVPDVVIPEPIAVGDRRDRGFVRDSRLILDEIPSATPLGPELEKGDLSETARARSIEQLGELTARVVAAGLYHRDYHLGNILLCGRVDGDRLALIDLHAARVGRRCSRRHRNLMLARMWHSLESYGATKDECTMFVRCVVRDDEFSKTVKAVRLLVRRWTVKRWKSRSRRCIKNSSKFEQGRLPSGRYSVLKEFGIESARRAVEVHQDGDPALVTTLKLSGQGHVTATKLESNRTVCVKEVRSRGFRKWFKTMFRQGRGRRAWMAVNGMAARGMATPQPFAYISQNTGFMDIMEYIVTEFLETCTSLQDYVETPAYKCALPSRKRRFTDDFARYLAALHERGVHQHDFKANNVLVEETGNGGWTFYLVDLDAVRFVASVSERRRISNLAQLASAISNSVNAAQRLRFMRTYADAANMKWNERDVVRRVLRKVGRRGGPWQIPDMGGADDG